MDLCLAVWLSVSHLAHSPFSLVALPVPAHARTRTHTRTPMHAHRSLAANELTALPIGLLYYTVLNSMSASLLWLLLLVVPLLFFYFWLFLRRVCCSSCLMFFCFALSCVSGLLCLSLLCAVSVIFLFLLFVVVDCVCIPSAVPSVVSLVYCFSCLLSLILPSC